MRRKPNTSHALEYKATPSIPLGYLETKQNYRHLKTVIRTLSVPVALKEVTVEGLSEARKAAFGCKLSVLG